MNNRAYTLAEARAIAGIGRTSIYKLIALGELRAVKIGGCTRILASDLDRWLDGLPPIHPKQNSPPKIASEPSAIVRHESGALDPSEG